MKTKSFAGDAALFYCALVWGAGFFLIKEVLHNVHPVTLLFYRFAISAAFMFAVVLKQRVKLTLFFKEGLYLSFFLIFAYVTQTWGLKYTTASNSGFITGLFVIFVPLLLWIFFRRPVSKSNWFAVLAALAGLWILTGGIGGLNKGDILTVICAPAYAMQIVLVDRYARRKNSNIFLLAFHQFWISTAFYFIACVSFDYSFTVTTARAVWIVIFLAVFPTLSAFFMQMWAQRKVEPVRAGLIITFEPVFGAIFAWTLGGEAIKMKSIAGGLLIIAAIVISELSQNRKLKKSDGFLITETV